MTSRAVLVQFQLELEQAAAAAVASAECHDSDAVTVTPPGRSETPVLKARDRTVSGSLLRMPVTAASLSLSGSRGHGAL